MIRAVFSKELVDGFRDQRSVLSSFIFPLVGPLVLVVTLWFVAEWQRTDRPLELPVVGAEHAPLLMNWLSAHGAKILEAPDNPEAMVKDGEAPAVLIVPESYEESFRSATPVRLRLLVDDSRNKTRRQAQEAQRLLAAYGNEIGSSRLLARGISPDIATPLRTERVDLATPGRLAASLLGMLPIFLVLAVFMGGMNVAIDATAGERERGSLEPLLINPVSRGGIMAGKLGVTILFSASVLALTVLAFKVAVRLFSFEGLGLDLVIGLEDAAWMFAVMLPVAFLAGVLQLLLATFARSFKEAQTYLSLLLFIPMLPGILLSMQPMQPEAWMMFIPCFSQLLLLSELIAGEPLCVNSFLISAAATLIVAAAAFVVTARLFRRERIIFGR